jgi:hypothetical protein
MAEISSGEKYFSVPPRVMAMYGRESFSTTLKGHIFMSCCTVLSSNLRVREATHRGGGGAFRRQRQLWVHDEGVGVRVVRAWERVSRAHAYLLSADQTLGVEHAA